MAEATDPGVTTAPPAEPATPVATEPEAPASNGSEPVTNPEEQTVPFSRFQEVNDKAKKAEEEAEQLREELAAKPTLPTSPDDDIDPEVVDLVKKSAAKLGYVTKEELDAQAIQTQVRQDIATLEASPPNPGIPYDHKAVQEYAKANNLPLTSKSALTAAYREMNMDKILEAERQKAIDGFKAGDGSGAEKPGSAGAQASTEPEVAGTNPKERTRNRIQAARQKLTI